MEPASLLNSWSLYSCAVVSWHWSTSWTMSLSWCSLWPTRRCCPCSTWTNSSTSFSSGHTYFTGLRIRIRIRVKSWIRIRIRVKSWIRIRIKVKIQELFEGWKWSHFGGPWMFTMEAWRLKNRALKSLEISGRRFAYLWWRAGSGSALK